MERLDSILLRSAGVDPANVSFDFRPLWQMDAAAAASIALQKAQATQIYAGLNLWPKDVTARLVESQLIEDGVFPGAEAIFGAAKAASVVADRGGMGRVALDFDPAQPRDPDGRWTAGSGSGPHAPDGTPIEPAGKNGTPRGNQRQNAQIDAIQRKLGLSKEQRELLHREISHQDYDYQEIMETAIEMFGEQRRKESGGGGGGPMGSKLLEE